MSLRVEGSRARERSTTRDRARDRSNVRADSPPSAVGYGDNTPGAFNGNNYEIRAPDSRSAYEYSKTTCTPYPQEDHYDPTYESRQYRNDRYEQRDRRRDDSDDDLAYGAQRKKSDHERYQTESQSYRTTTFAPDDRYGQPDSAQHRAERPQNYRQSSLEDRYATEYRNVRPEAHRQSSSRDNYSEHSRQSSMPYEQETRPEYYRQSSSYDKVSTVVPDRHRQTSTYEQDARIVDITPEHTRDRKDSDVHRITRTTSNALVPAGLEPRMSRLSVSGNRPDMHGGGGLPPPSPLLEAYHGTYQSLSPMPTAMRLDDDLDDIPSLDRSKHSKVVEKKHVKLYDPAHDARTLAKALSSSSPNAEVICDILPPLSDDQIWELRKEYKKQVKISGKGINLSKHLKLKLSGNFGKVVYVTALGRWESEGYWANFFYQSHGSRRELLIESLMGRTNADIRSIKDEFKDKRYNDDLVRCMEKELKMDKFRTAILMSLEGRRQEEQDVYPQEYRDHDVDTLHRALRSSGGESAMLEVVVRRSDAHLREILRQYEKMYGENFARVALKKSNNLVGEVIAHILNGVINKPARDALLLKHAIKDVAAHNKDDELRYELLISRLIRLHWDRLHMMRVKKEYKEKYGKYLEDDLEASTKGDFRDFICELCEVQGAK